MRHSRGAIRVWRGIQAWRGSLRLHVIVSIVSMLLPVFLLAGVGHLLVRPLTARFATISKENLEEFSALMNMHSALLETSEALHTYLNTSDAPTRERLSQALRAADTAMQRLRTAPFSEAEGASLPAIADAWQQIHGVTAILIDARHRLRLAERSSTSESYHVLAERIEQSMDKMHGLLRAEIIGELRETKEAEDNLLRGAGWSVLLACGISAVAAWQADRAVPLTVRISVNISIKQLEDPAFVSDVGQALRESGLSPKSLILEITETVLAQDPIAADALLKGLKQVGVQVAVDDFGVGYSSLNYLRRLPVDIVKIDRTFVGSLSGPAEMALTSAIIALSKALKLQTLAEGVERPEQAGELRALGCDSAQGFLFAKPLDAAQMEALLNSARANDNQLPLAPTQPTQKAS